ncbi:50S ribosomal protein L22 [Paracoccus sanguinis]|uniref:Large ribosomal subunit protein uL22 n=1 Tax=Paracoccus sanguinis TaxID=1545044 RepID=A0A099G2Z2_9RHOB|nr:50S ribosomal protein L22 [Paracoccus sanguinis]KGJ18430.1 50S ribosomal protein L22 [Paracoccus sanguinis]KGJ23158.1 50S ribosomal protein L22 [Paracoccus sanguinis]QJD17066.1 50S ribosomal protein L22 [Paracoccus sanguinis]SDW48853.1 LSU ribosomal protein L22P [Paracoccus sanguinis]
MGKEQNPRRVAENEAMAKTKMLRTSPQKLNLVAAMIRGKKVDKALADLTFSKRRIAGDVKKCLQSAIANAENNHNLDVDSLIVAEAWVGKNMVMKRGRPRARGRFGKIMKPFSEITITVREIDVAAAEAAKKAAKTQKRTASNRQAEATTTPEAAAEELA